MVKVFRVTFLLTGPSKNYRQIVHVESEDGRQWQFPVPWDEDAEVARLAAACVTGGIPVGNADRDMHDWKIAIEGPEDCPYWLWTYYNENKRSERWIVHPGTDEACSAFERWYESFYGKARFFRNRGRRKGGFRVVVVKRSSENQRGS